MKTAGRAFRSQLAALISVVIVGSLLASCGIGGTPPPPSGVTNINFPTNNGANTYAWSMQEFNGRIYIGTAREIRCVEFATAAFYNVSTYPPTELDVDCARNPDDLPLQSQIWEYNPFTGALELVWVSPLVDNPSRPGTSIAKYFGVRGMMVHEGVLYANGFTTGDYDRDLVAAHPPSLLRSRDGRNWEEVPNQIRTVATPFGSNDTVVGFRSPASVNGRFFVTASRGLLGDGAVVEIIRPGSANPQWVQVSPADVLAYEIEAFNNQLYVGTGDLDAGYSVYRWNTNYSSPFVPLVTDGAGRGSDMASVVVMDVFQGRLYVGSSGWESQAGIGAITNPPQAELIRVNADDSWDLVVGDPRQVRGRAYNPISGQRDGFGNFYAAHLWRGAVFQGGYYVGTNDWAWLHRDIPLLRQQALPEMGFDMWVTCNGEDFTRVTRTAFGDGEFNFGLRSMAVTADGGTMLLGSANYIEGTDVWTYQGRDC